MRKIQGEAHGQIPSPESWPSFSNTHQLGGVCRCQKRLHCYSRDGSSFMQVPVHKLQLKSSWFPAVSDSHEGIPRYDRTDDDSNNLSFCAKALACNMLEVPARQARTMGSLTSDSSCRYPAVISSSSSSRRRPTRLRKWSGRSCASSNAFSVFASSVP